jgi:hypothetical protein
LLEPRLQRRLDQIGLEVRAAQQQKPEAIALGSFPPRLRGLVHSGLSVWLVLPAAVRRLIWTWALANPYRRKRLSGTVGMFGRGVGWGVTPMGHTLALVVGGLSNRRVVVGADTAPREYLCLTLTMDHDVIDGAQAARFTAHLKKLIESCAGLPDWDGPAASRARSASAAGANPRFE